MNLHDLVQETSPGGPSGNLGTVGVDGLPVELTTATVDIHLVGAEPAGTLPGESDDPEEHDDEESKVRREETLSVVQVGAGGSDGVVELSAPVSERSKYGSRGFEKEFHDLQRR